MTFRHDANRNFNLVQFIYFLFCFIACAFDTIAKKSLSNSNKFFSLFSSKIFVAGQMGQRPKYIGLRVNFCIWCKVASRHLNIIIIQEILASLCGSSNKGNLLSQDPWWEGILAIQVILQTQCKENHGFGKVWFHYLPTSLTRTLIVPSVLKACPPPYPSRSHSLQTSNKSPPRYVLGRRVSLSGGPAECQKLYCIISFCICSRYDSTCI